MTARAALALEQTRTMDVTSDILGPLSVPDDEVLRFPAGLLGLPEARRFALLAAKRSGMFWLQSVEQSSLTFVLVDPFLYFDGYEVDVSPADLAELGAADAAEVAIMAIVTLPRSREEQPTANLQGPLAVSLRSRTGKQIILQETPFGVRCPLDLLKDEG